MENKFQFPTEVIELPSKGLLYPKDSPLSSGKVEMKYMTAREEDILTNQNYIQNGTVVDRLLKSLIIDDKINYNDLLTGDKNALLIAARVLGYGKDYEIEYNGETVQIDLSILENKPLREDVITGNENRFPFTLPSSNINVEFKFLTHGDQNKIDQELTGLRKINKNFVPELSTRIKYMLVSVDGEEDRKVVREFVDNYLLARDSRALRDYIAEVQPDIDLMFYPEGGPEGGVPIPIGVSFLWPDAGI